MEVGVITTRLLLLILSLESGVGNSDNGHAKGPLQIWPAVVEDVNRVYGTSFTWADCSSLQKSNVICNLYLTWWGKVYEKRTGKKVSDEVLLRIWNGGPSGYKKKATDRYIRRAVEKGFWILGQH